MDIIATIGKKDIELKITAYEVRYRYSYSKMKNTIIPLKIVKRTSTTVVTKSKRIFHDIYESIRYSRWQRNQLAAIIAFVSGIIFPIVFDEKGPELGIVVALTIAITIVFAAFKHRLARNI